MASSQAVSSPTDRKAPASHSRFSGPAVCHAHTNGSGRLPRRRRLAAPGRSWQASAITRMRSSAAAGSPARSGLEAIARMSIRPREKARRSRQARARGESRDEARPHCAPAPARAQPQRPDQARLIPSQQQRLRSLLASKTRGSSRQARSQLSCLTETSPVSPSLVRVGRSCHRRLLIGAAAVPSHATWRLSRLVRHPVPCLSEPGAAVAPEVGGLIEVGGLGVSSHWIWLGNSHLPRLGPAGCPRLRLSLGWPRACRPGTTNRARLSDWGTGRSWRR
jgi:hypothetical protein